MDSLRTALFEDPFYIYLALILVGIAMAGAWYGQRQRVWLLRMLVPVALAVGVCLLERAVVTDREQIRLALEEVAAAAERSDFGTFATFLDEKYHGWGGRRAEAVALAEASILKWRIHQVQIVGEPEIDITGGNLADVSVRTVVHYAGSGSGAGRYALRWRMEWVKRPDGWKIRRAATTDSPIP